MAKSEETEQLQKLTKRQKKVWNWLVQFWWKNDNIPSTRHMQFAFRWGSQNSAMQYINTFVDRGYLEPLNVQIPSSVGRRSTLTKTIYKFTAAAKEKYVYDYNEDESREAVDTDIHDGGSEASEA